MTHRRTFLALLGAVLLGSAACTPTPDAPPAQPTTDGPAHVEVVQTDGRYQLLVDGEPFYVEGAGLEFGDVESLAAHGGNAFRTWRTDNGRETGQEVLDRAHANGLMVVMGLEVAREREGQGRGYFGFDYDDEEAIAAQVERLRAEVMQYKDHPALLMWGIGNELNLGATNPRVWDGVNAIAEMIKEVDPHHPTTTMLAGISSDLVVHIRARAPSLDVLSIQMYADISNLPRYIDETGWDGPYLVTEWGATGHWEVEKTPWEAPIENTSSVKADYYLERYQTAIASDTVQALGSFVFLWGQKQERTPTWYGLFLPTGEETESVDVMHYLWNDTWPDNRTPRLENATLDGKVATDGIYLAAGQTYPAEVTTTDPDGDTLVYQWEVRHESTEVSEGGDDEEVPEAIAGLIDAPAAAQIQMTAPTEPGAYRLFVYVYDGQGHAAHANLPFYVNE